MKTVTATLAEILGNIHYAMQPNPKAHLIYWISAMIVYVYTLRSGIQKSAIFSESYSSELFHFLCHSQQIFKRNGWKQTATLHSEPHEEECREHFSSELMEKKKLSFLAVKCTQHFTTFKKKYTPKKLHVVHVYKRKNHMGIWDLQHRNVHSATLTASIGTI